MSVNTSSSATEQEQKPLVSRLTSSVAAPKKLTDEHTGLLRGIFAKIDTNNSGSIDTTEATEFGRMFSDNADIVDKGARKMFHEVDKDKDNKLSVNEWLEFFSRLIPDSTPNAEVSQHLRDIADHITLSQQPIKWTPSWRTAFVVILFLQLGLCAAILGLSAQSSDQWMVINEYTNNPVASSSLRYAYTIIGIVCALIGIVAGLKEIPAGMKVFAFLSVSVFILNVASIIFDALGLADVIADCQTDCQAQKIDACECVSAGGLKATIGVSFVLTLFSALPAFMAVYFSTSWGNNRFIRRWAKAYSDLSGVSAARRTLAKGFWFQQAEQGEQKS